MRRGCSHVGPSTAGRARLLRCRAVRRRKPGGKGHGPLRRAPKLGAARAEVRLAGRATAACSPRCEAGGALSLDWHAPGAEMRIQVDHVFKDGAGDRALEITTSRGPGRARRCTRQVPILLALALAAAGLPLRLGGRAGGP